jgi:hypothetical protein
VDVLARDGVDHGLGIRDSASEKLVGEAKVAQIFDHEDEVMCCLVERGEVRTRRPQRVGQADLLVEAHLAKVKLEVFAEFRPHPGGGHRKLHDQRVRHIRAALEVGTVQAAEQTDTDADLLEPAFPHVSS